MSLSLFLKRELARRRQRNARYSLRAFARDLECDHSTLSQWMRGRRPLTEEATKQLCDALGLDARERARACELDATDLSILEATAETRSRSPRTLAKSLGLSGEQFNVSLFKLMRLGLVRLEGKRWHVAPEARS